MAAGGKRPSITSPASPVEPLLNTLVRRSWEASRWQYKVPKPLSVQAVSTCLPTSMWTFCVSVAASRCCDLTGEKN